MEELPSSECFREVFLGDLEVEAGGRPRDDHLHWFVLRVLGVLLFAFLDALLQRKLALAQSLYVLNKLSDLQNMLGSKE